MASIWVFWPEARGHQWTHGQCVLNSLKFQLGTRIRSHWTHLIILCGIDVSSFGWQVTGVSFCLGHSGYDGAVLLAMTAGATRWYIFSTSLPLPPAQPLSDVRCHQSDLLWTEAGKDSLLLALRDQSGRPVWHEDPYFKSSFKFLVENRHSQLGIWFDHVCWPFHDFRGGVLLVLQSPSETTWDRSLKVAILVSKMMVNHGIGVPQFFSQSQLTQLFRFQSTVCWFWKLRGSMWLLACLWTEKRTASETQAKHHLRSSWGSIFGSDLRLRFSIFFQYSNFKTQLHRDRANVSFHRQNKRTPKWTHNRSNQHKDNKEWNCCNQPA